MKSWSASYFLLNSLVCAAFPSPETVPRPRRNGLSRTQQRQYTEYRFEQSAAKYAQLSSANASEMYRQRKDLTWRAAPNAWHQQLARIVDHRFYTFKELQRYALGAKQAGVSALMLVQIQRTESCPGPWYNGLQLCDHINGSYPVSDGSLQDWQALVSMLRPMRLMWWNNPTYWSTQGPVWAQALRDKQSDVGKWFSWGGSSSCDGIPPCDGVNVVGEDYCAQGSWGSTGEYSGSTSALASFGSKSYSDYLVDAFANTWTAKLGIDGYTEDCSSNYPCMLQLADPSAGSLPDWASITRRVRALQPQVVTSGEFYGSWSEVILADANMGGQGFPEFHTVMQEAVLSGDASQVERVASTSGADAATVLCYLHPAFDGQQPGACPTMYFRDTTATMPDPAKHLLWVALEAGSGIVSQHDYDPNSSCLGWDGCGGGRGAWWNVTNDPSLPNQTSPLWAFTQQRALNRLALRTKLNASTTAAVHWQSLQGGAAGGDGSGGGPAGYAEYVHSNCYDGAGGTDIDQSPLVNLSLAECAERCTADQQCDCVVFCAKAEGYCQQSGNCWRRGACLPADFQHDKDTLPFSVYVKDVSPTPPPTPPDTARGAIAYLKHDALGPDGAAALLVYNPGPAQTLTIDLRLLPPDLLDGSVVPRDFFDPSGKAPPALAGMWTVEMGAGEAKAFGGFSLASFAPRLGKKSGCTADDGFSRPAAGATLQACFLECLADDKCDNVFVEYIAIVWMEAPPAANCTLLGAVSDPSVACQPGRGTLVQKLPDGRPH